MVIAYFKQLDRTLQFAWERIRARRDDVPGGESPTSAEAAGQPASL
jgi:hypothetical protein